MNDISNTQLVPVLSAVLSEVKRESLSPAMVTQRLGPAQVIDLPDQTIYWYIKLGAKKTEGRALSRLLADPSVARQCAMITLHKSDRTFNLQWFPHDGGEIECHLNLPAERLAAAVDDLIGAGF